MKKIFKSKALAVFLVGVIIYGCVMAFSSDLLKDKLSVNKFLDMQNPEEFYSLEKNSVDVLAIGASQILSSFSAAELYEEYGYAAFGLGTAQQNPFGTYYWLREALETQSPKIVILEVAGISRNFNEHDYFKAFVGMKNTSPHKFEAVQNIVNEIKPHMEFLEFYSPIYKFHSRWDSLNEDDFEYLRGQVKRTYLGACINTSVYTKAINPEDYYVERIDVAQYDTDNQHYTYFEKIHELCEEKGIQMIFFKSPRPTWSSEYHSVVADFAEKNNIPFFDYNSKEFMEEIGFELDKDMADSGHANIEGAIKITEHIGKYINENYDIPDVRGNSAYKKTEEAYQGYLNELNLARIKMTKNFEDTIKLLNDLDISFILTKKGEVKWNDELQAELKELGFSASFDTADNVALVKNGEKILLDITSAGKIERYRYLFPGFVNYQVVMDKEKNYGRINGISKTCTEEASVLFVLYDNKDGRVICNRAYDSDLKLIK